MHLAAGSFESIRSGRKDIEMRLFDEKRQQLRVGDTILFDDRDDPGRSVRAVIAALHRFPSFEMLYAAFPPERLGYREDEAASASFRDMEAYYSAAEQARWGVVGIELRLL